MQRQEGDRLVLYRGHQLFVLGSYSAEIWHLCDGQHTIKDMAEIVVNKYNVARERAMEEITGFLNQLMEKNLIVI
ncbi:MAG: PqqD family protein [Firmicutes bacterium]|nr:PqqD family protein [Bacillota bacterium]